MFDGGLLQGMFLLLAISMLLLPVAMMFDDRVAVNVTETVVGKDISHPYSFVGSDNHYNVYTTRNCFSVSLIDYNNINIGDNLTVEYNNSIAPPTLHFNHSMYYSD